MKGRNISTMTNTEIDLFWQSPMIKGISYILVYQSLNLWQNFDNKMESRIIFAVSILPSFTHFNIHEKYHQYIWIDHFTIKHCLTYILEAFCRLFSISPSLRVTSSLIISHKLNVPSDVYLDRDSSVVNLFRKLNLFIHY